MNNCGRQYNESIPQTKSITTVISERIFTATLEMTCMSGSVSVMVWFILFTWYHTIVSPDNPFTLIHWYIIGHVNEYPTMHYFGNPRHTQSINSIYDFDRVFLEIPVKGCLMGMLSICPIRSINTSSILTAVLL